MVFGAGSTTLAHNRPLQDGMARKQIRFISMVVNREMMTRFDRVEQIMNSMIVDYLNRLAHQVTQEGEGIDLLVKINNILLGGTGC